MLKCVRCNQSRKSSSLKCPIVKSYRAELTRKHLLINNYQPTATNLINKDFIFNQSNFPAPLARKSSSPLSSSNNLMLSKLDEMIGKLSEVKDQLVVLEAKHNKFEQFMVMQNQKDEATKENLNTLSHSYINLKKDVVQHDLLISRHDNMFIKLFIPMFQDLFFLIAAQNCDKKGNPMDADLKCRLDRYLIQMKKAAEGKSFSN